MNWVKLLRYFIIGGTFVVPFIPFIIANSMFFPFITGKNFTFRILVELLFGAWVLLALLEPMYRVRLRHGLFIAFAAFIGVMGLATIFSADPRTSFWSNFERMEGYLALVHLFMYFIVAGSVLHTEKLWKAWFNTTVIASVIMAFYGFLQLSGAIDIRQGSLRLDGTLGNATYLAVYMLFHVFIALLLMVKTRARFLQCLYGITILLQGAILFYTATRGAILGLVGGLLLTAILIALTERNRPLLRRIALGGLIGIVLIVGGFIAIKETAFVRDNPVLTRIASISLSEGETRFTIWRMAFEGVKERPILGWGQENFNLVFNKHYNPALYDQEPWFDRVHNIVLDWLIAGGVLGLLSYVSLFLAGLYYLWRRSGERFSATEKSLITGLFAGYAFHNLFVFDNVASYILFASMLAFIYSRSGSAESGEETRTVWRADHSSALRVATPLVIAAVVFSIYFFNVRGIVRAEALVGAITFSGGTPEALAERNFKRFQNLAEENGMGSQEVAEQLVQTATRVLAQNIGTEEIRESFFDLAVAEMREEIKRSPDDARPHLFLGSLLLRGGAFAEAEEMLLRGHELTPNKQTMLFELGVLFAAQGDTESAKTYFEKAFLLAPEFDQARVLFAAGLIYDGGLPEAEALLEERFGDAVIDDNTLLNAYAAAGRYEKVREIWEKRAADDPGNEQNHLSLAAAYIALGRTEDAVARIEHVIEINPAFRERGEFFIREIRAGRVP